MLMIVLRREISAAQVFSDRPLLGFRVHRSSSNYSWLTYKQVSTVYVIVSGFNFLFVSTFI
jgi:hypothetical protein